MKHLYQIYSIPSYLDAPVTGTSLYRAQVSHSFNSYMRFLDDHYRSRHCKPVISSSKELQRSLLRVTIERGLCLAWNLLIRIGLTCNWRKLCLFLSNGNFWDTGTLRSQGARIRGDWVHCYGRTCIHHYYYCSSSFTASTIPEYIQMLHGI